MPRAPDQTTLATLGEAGRAEAHRRWLVLRPHLEDGVPLTRVAAQSGIPHRTLQRWLVRYRAGGLAGLGRAVRADRGRSRFPGPLRLLVEGLALRTPVPSAAQVHRQVTAVAEREGWPVPSYSSVYAIIRRIDPALRTLAVEGARRYAEVFELVHRRQAGRPNEIWQADHTQLDLWVVTPAGRPARPWLTVIEDDHVSARNAAITLLAVTTGLRACDIIGLRLADVDWRGATIAVVQQKTGNPLTLPLPPLVMGKLCDYVLGERPATADEHVFVRSVAPHVHLADHASVHQVISATFAAAGVADGKAGTRFLRHSAATRLLRAAVPLPTISAVLGHSAEDSTSVYMNADRDRLLQCVLPVPAGARR